MASRIENGLGVTTTRSRVNPALSSSSRYSCSLRSRWHFADSGHFSRTFKKQHGLTPTAYAASARGRREKA